MVTGLKVWLINEAPIFSLVTPCPHHHCKQTALHLMTVAMRLKEQEAHQGIYSDEQWRIRLCGLVGLAAKAPVPDSQLSPRTFSAGATEDAQWLRNRAQCRTGLTRTVGEEVCRRHGAGCGLGNRLLCLVLPAPKATDFLGKPRRGVVG